MIHPHTTLKPVNEIIGSGVFATQPIPAGTITYVLDAFDMNFLPGDPLLGDPRYAPIIKKYSVRDPDGSYTMCWDISRYMNHCCHYNTISTAYGFDIAVREIAAGEEITDDYGMFNLEHPMRLVCRYPDCRMYAYPDDFDRHAEQWDADVRQALSKFQSVPQPLLPYIEPQTLASLTTYLSTGQGYLPVSLLRFQG